MGQVSLFIPQSGSFTENIPDRVPLKGDSLPSSERIKKIALKIFGGVAFTLASTAAVSMSIGLISFPLGLGLILTALTVIAISFILHRNIIDYTDPETIKSLRLTSENSNWATLIYTHGLPNLLKYNIITPSKCREIFQEKLTTLSFLEASSLYEQLVQSIKTHSPSKERFLSAIGKRELIDWGLKWKNEVRDLSACQINERYKISQLRNTGVFDVAELFFLQEALQRFQEAKADRQRKIEELKEEFSLQIRHHQQDLHREQVEADGFYHAILDPQRTVAIQEEFDREEAAISAEKARVIGRINGIIEEITRMLTLPQTDLDQQSLLEEKRLLEDQVIQVEQIAQETTRQAWGIFLGKRQRFAAEIAGADAERVSRYESAYADFSSIIAPAVERREQKLMVINNDFIAIKQFLNQEYQNTFKS